MEAGPNCGRRPSLPDSSWSMVNPARPRTPRSSFGVCRGCFRPGAGTGGLLEGLQESGSPRAVSRARQPQNPQNAAGFQSRLSRSPPGASDGRARGTGGPTSESRSLVAGARANSKPNRTARKLRSHLSRAPPETSDRRAQEAAASGPLSRPACNEQPPARARVTLLHYATRSEHQTQHSSV